MAPMDGAVQKFVPSSLQARLLYYSRYATMADHRGKRRKEDTMQREYYWPQVANEVYTTKRDCP